jgi:hypothetical protein
MSGGLQSLMTVAGIAHGNALHDLSQRAIGNLQECVKMVRHPTKSMHPRTEAIDHISDDVIKDLAVGRSVEQSLAVVAAQNCVVKAVRHM